uniref:Uncharacterized protein n=1 Tax=Noctiluca scintillans TaxID=2966 RepID=A0A7S1AYW0_NOCSC
MFLTLSLCMCCSSLRQFYLYLFAPLVLGMLSVTDRASSFSYHTNTHMLLSSLFFLLQSVGPGKLLIFIRRCFVIQTPVEIFSLVLGKGFFLYTYMHGLHKHS